MQRVKKHHILLQALRSATPKTRVAIIKAAPDGFIRALIDITLHILNGKISIGKATLNRFKCHKGKIRNFAKSKDIPKARDQLSQRGGILPFLLPFIPALIAAGKAAALGAVSAGVGYGVKKGLDKL